MTIHDTSRWAGMFERNLAKPEISIAHQMRNAWPLLFWLMHLRGDILEVGAGSGLTCVLARRLCPYKRVVATDIDTDTIKVMSLMAERLGSDIEIKQMDALDLEFPDQSFGIAFSMGLLEHYDDEWILAALKEQLRVAEVVIAGVPTDHFFFIHGREYGDERKLQKVTWLGLCSQAGDIIEVTSIGEYTQEEWVLVLITERRGERVGSESVRGDG